MLCMKYPHFLVHLIIKNNTLKKIGGFILPSIVISILISSFVLIMVMTICMTCFIWTERIDDSLAMLEDGRYTRRAIVAHIIWNDSKTSVDDKGHTLSINDTRRTAFTVTRRALYRKLSDGSLQPLSGSRIIGTDDKRRLDADTPFSMNSNGVVNLQWSVNNLFNTETEYAKGYGGIANYEVATGVSTHFDWYKKTH